MTKRVTKVLFSLKYINFELSENQYLDQSYRKVLIK